ncbi:MULTISPECIES: GNAT family N-acetyltransferase [Bacillus]|uniref:GNAT family N-acetyltransferase n=1 Tax=Bacillus paranthracis TaxID=2026186 RepID=A0AAJ1ND43_9BACI|nr:MULTISPECIES: GNAT family N-acetyltransferase [Bacillus]MCW4574700.1 GNAT family N-acetyltransferase [Bacillus pacificus]MDA1584756.1 GNAT family N-acetyltransferase [Bacillus cereus group sp. TH230-1LC]MBG9906394.1 benzoate transporter [Bacillus paranthracis]MDG0946724.1 GNAT family N-acetyltransferase [Bacillus paranthracis]MDG0952667.1 GNAT family N-acetyltransferase [Bacillus paranthracis]
MTVLYEGRLKQNNELFHVTLLTIENIEQILSLQNVVIETLEDKSRLQPLSLEEFQYILEGNGMMIGAFIENELIAFRALLVPPIDDEHLGLDIGLPESELHRVIYQEISNVHPNCRGNGMQKILATVIMDELQKENSKYDYVCCTVAPFNIPSLKDKFSQGMEIAALKEKYGGSLRYVFVKELRGDKERDWTEIKSVPMSDAVGQQALLSDGYRGYEMEKVDGDFVVKFGR